MRLFIAIDLGAELTHELAVCARRLAPAFTDAKWVRPDAMHLTLCFLGETPEERLDEATTAVAAAVADQSCFACELRGIGAFPDLRRPAVIWAGVTLGTPALERLAYSVRERLASTDLGTDGQPFSAHVTLGRIRRGSRTHPQTAQDALRPWVAVRFGTFTVDHVTIYASTLTPAGPVYSPLRVWPLPPA